MANSILLLLLLLPLRAAPPWGPRAGGLSRAALGARGVDGAVLREVELGGLPDQGEGRVPDHLVFRLWGGGSRKAKGKKGLPPLLGKLSSYNFCQTEIANTFANIGWPGPLTIPHLLPSGNFHRRKGKMEPVWRCSPPVLPSKYDYALGGPILAIKQKRRGIGRIPPGGQ